MDQQRPRRGGGARHELEGERRGALGDQPPPRAGEATLVGFLLIVVGLAAKIGWAPVHNWLPDAHSEAPPPVSALLSAALLPSVLLGMITPMIAARSRVEVATPVGLLGVARNASFVRGVTAATSPSAS